MDKFRLVDIHIQYQTECNSQITFKMLQRISFEQNVLNLCNSLKLLQQLQMGFLLFRIPSYLAHRSFSDVLYFLIYFYVWNLL